MKKYVTYNLTKTNSAEEEAIPGAVILAAEEEGNYIKSLCVFNVPFQHVSGITTTCLISKAFHVNGSNAATTLREFRTYVKVLCHLMLCKI